MEEVSVLPLADIPLLRKVLSHIDAHPEEWDQKFYIRETNCGTTHCVAGHVLALTGDCPKDWLYPAVKAQERLGITLDEAWGDPDVAEDEIHWQPGLFDVNATRQDIQGIAERIAERAGDRL